MSAAGLFSWYFPKAEGSSSLLNPGLLPERPEAIGPIHDPLNSSTPIPKYDEEAQQLKYGERPADVNADLPPTTPPDFEDRYLVPTLTKHERIRLTLLWYYTRDIVNDKDFLLRLQEKLDLVKDFMGWEFAILGIVSENVFTRLVTAGIPLAVLPRRESTCSHTITLSSGVSLSSDPSCFDPLCKTNHLPPRAFSCSPIWPRTGGSNTHLLSKRVVCAVMLALNCAARRKMEMMLPLAHCALLPTPRNRPCLPLSRLRWSVSQT